MNKVIFLIDIDAFFAQAEEIRNPEYKGKSIVVGHFMNGRGVITTGNYKVRELMGGSVSGMPYHKVKRVISDLIIVEPDYEYYSELTESLAQILKSYCTELEPSSIDEYYLDVTKIAHKYSSVENLADKIRIRILKELNLTVSIGVSDNKILAKMASSMNKPFGTTILFKDSLKTKLWPLKISKLHMCGRATTQVMEENSIYRIGDLAKLKVSDNKYQVLENRLGKSLDKLYSYSRGISENTLNVEKHKLASVSKHKTMTHDISDYDMAREELNKLIIDVVDRMKYRNLVGKTVYIQTKLKVWTLSSFQKTLKKHTDSIDVIASNIIELFDKYWETEPEVRFLGIGVSNLVDKMYYSEQRSFWEEKEPGKPEEDFVKYLNHRIGYRTFITLEMYDNFKQYHDKRISSNDRIAFKRWDK